MCPKFSEVFTGKLIRAEGEGPRPDLGVTLGFRFKKLRFGAGEGWILLRNPKILVSNPRVFAKNPFIFLGNPRVLAKNPLILLGNPGILPENPRLF